MALTTYPEAGATRRGPLPAGYRHLRYRTRVGAGATAFAGAVEAVLSWRMHEAMGVPVRADAPRAAPGVSVSTRPGLGPFRMDAPCVVVWTEEGERRGGFGYGTVTGHPLRGEEAFVVTRDADGVVWLEVVAFSRAVRWWVWLAGPLLPLFQRFYARRCGAALRRLTTARR
ncbi:DUF1990 domain-containing protein [Phytohabitans sp. ZYX-F-186]|uniref:DUF1990 domain-containing protein n=1 Tax=Phytohabitans maris TaxID=3071409 RepID=A0ABU0ZTG6_9ACTN|nr:DUF1990 domain-containing protein [Phytohabitans sp. ZYX-F-186]MDQ7909500.1 DUF1990 domain-containing protein [Phytohabitans sp. ZYX-F-186]